MSAQNLHRGQHRSQGEVASCCTNRHGDGADVGDILVSSWGYDQTNKTFYRVMKRTARTVWLQQMHSELANGEEGFMQGHSLPTAVDPRAKVRRRKVHLPAESGMSEVAVRLSSYEWARPWTGKPEWISWYG